METAASPVAVSANDIYYSLPAVQFARAYTAFVSGVEMSVQWLKLDINESFDPAMYSTPSLYLPANLKSTRKFVCGRRATVETFAPSS